MIILSAHTFDSSMGYGKWARTILASLQRLGYNVLIQSGLTAPEDLKYLLRTGVPDILVYPPFTKSSAPIQFTTYESTILAESMIKELRKRRLVVVLSEYNKQMCADSNVKAHVCHPVVSGHYKLPAAFSQFTFLHAGADNSVPERKRTVDVLTAFQKAFPKESDVRLIIKKDPCDTRIPCYDSRVTMIYDKQDSLEPLYDTAHVGVFPCGQEGWGYCQSELMALGRPVIVPFYGGPKDFCDDSNAYQLPFKLVKTPKAIYNNLGQCARVAVKDIIKAMRFCYENKEDVVLKGVLAARKMAGFSESRMDARIEELLKKV